jgi:hypothetical protein
MSWATISTSTPAGSSRIVAKKKGAVSGITPFIATIAVPHRKKGETMIGSRKRGLVVDRFKAMGGVSDRQTIEQTLLQYKET